MLRCSSPLKTTVAKTRAPRGFAYSFFAMPVSAGSSCRSARDTVFNAPPQAGQAPNGLLNGVCGARVGADDPHWAAIHADFAVYLKTVKKYDVIRYFNYMNEPNGGWMWPGGKVDYAAWAQGMRNLRQELPGCQMTRTRPRTGTAR